MKFTDTIKELEGIFDRNLLVSIPELKDKQIGFQFAHRHPTSKPKTLNVYWYFNGMPPLDEVESGYIPSYSIGFDVSLGSYAARTNVPLLHIEVVLFLVDRLYFLGFRDIVVLSEADILGQQKGTSVTVTATYRP